MLYVVALITFVASIGFWFAFTKPFIQEEGRHASFDAAIEPLGLVLDFFKAMSISVTQKRRAPLGIYAHGLLVLLTVFFLVRAMIVDPLGS